jgi:uncharacterized membrane protein
MKQSQKELRDAEKILRNDARRHHADRVTEVTIAGTIAGAAVGAVAGPPGALAGAVIGGVAGALAGEAMDLQTTRDEVEDDKLDREIGVMGGDMGVSEEAKRPRAERRSRPPAAR